MKKRAKEGKIRLCCSRNKRNAEKLNENRRLSWHGKGHEPVVQGEGKLCWARWPASNQPSSNEQVPLAGDTMLKKMNLYTTDQCEQIAIIKLFCASPSNTWGTENVDSQPYLDLT